MMLSLEVGTMELGTLVSTAGAWSYESLRISRDLVAFAVSHCITIITITIIITIIIIITNIIIIIITIITIISISLHLIASHCISLHLENRWTAKVVQLATSVADENYRFAVKAR